MKWFLRGCFRLAVNLLLISGMIYVVTYFAHYDMEMYEAYIVNIILAFFFLGVGTLIKECFEDE